MRRVQRLVTAPGGNRSPRGSRSCNSDFETADAGDGPGEFETDGEGVTVACVLPRRTLEHVATARIDPFDRDILDAVLAWGPFGGPPDEECLPRFGLTACQLERRVKSLIERGRHARYSPTDGAKLIAAARIIACCDDSARR